MVFLFSKLSAMVRIVILVLCIITVIKGSPICNVVGNHYEPSKKCNSDEIIQKLVNERGLSLESLTSVVADTMKDILHKHVTQPLKTALVCTACKSVVNSAKYGLNTGASEDELLNIVGNLLCDYFQILSPEICNEYLYLAGPPLLYILNNTSLPPEVVCSFVMSNTCDIETPPEIDWEIQIPPKPIKIKKTKPIFKEEKRVIKILHLADTHIDDQYVEGSWDDCDLPLCCRDPPPNNTSSRSGKWGGWKCDIPARTFQSLLDFVVNNITDVDHVVWTGDIPAHDLWGQSQEKNLELINKTISTLKSYFNGENSVLPSLGNHEPVPGNLLPTPLITESDSQWSNNWLYNTMATQWTSDWLSINESTIKYGAFYKTEYRPGLIVVSINSVFCYFNNWWLILDNKDPGGELSWLIETLLEAESQSAKVHIIAHVPPGSSDCLKVWQRNYYRIIERFEDTVAAQFFGHTHNDEFSLILNNNDNKKTSSLMLTGPSATTYTYLNPGFRIYYIDGDHENTTRQVLDFETWIMDLEESNRLDSPVWKKLYTAKEAYGLNSMDPEEWRNVYERIKTDDQVLQQYHRFFWKDSPKRPVCDETCRKEYLCSIVSCTQYGDPQINNRFW